MTNANETTKRLPRTLASAPGLAAPRMAAAGKDLGRSGGIRSPEGGARCTLTAAAVVFCLALAASASGQARPHQVGFGLFGEGSQVMADGKIFVPGFWGPKGLATNWMNDNDPKAPMWELYRYQTYMGQQSYRVRSLTVRSEQKVFASWDISKSSKHSHTHYFTFAFYAEALPPGGWFCVSQLCSPLEGISQVGCEARGLLMLGTEAVQTELVPLSCEDFSFRQLPGIAQHIAEDVSGP